MNSPSDPDLPSLPRTSTWLYLLHNPEARLALIEMRGTPVAQEPL